MNEFLPFEETQGRATGTSIRLPPVVPPPDRSSRSVPSSPSPSAPAPAAAPKLNLPPAVGASGAVSLGQVAQADGAMPLNLADPLFRDLILKQRELVELTQARRDMPAGQLMATASDFAELMSSVEELSERLSLKYGLDKQTLGDLITPTNVERLMASYPWYETAVADERTIEARRLMREAEELEGAVAQSLPMDMNEEDLRALQFRVGELMGASQTIRDILAEEYGADPKDIDRLLNVDGDATPDEQIMQFLDPGGLTGLARGFVEGMFTTSPEWSRSERLSVMGGRALGMIADSFVGALEPLAIPHQLSMNSVSNLATLRELDPARLAGPRTFTELVTEQAAEMLRLGSNPLGVPFVAAGTLLADTFRAWSALLDPEVQALNFVQLEEEDGGGRGLMNLETGRTVRWIDFNSRFRLGNLQVGFGERLEYAVTGVDYLEQVGLFERFGITNPIAKEAVGAIADFVMDPLLWTEGIFATAKILAMTGQKGAARELARLGQELRRTTSTPRGLVDHKWAREGDAWRYVDDPYGPDYYSIGRTPEQTRVMQENGARPVLERAMVSMARTLDRFFNLPIPTDNPFSRVVLGISDQTVNQIPLRYFLFTEGVVDLPLSWLRRRISNLPEQFTGSPLMGPSIRDRSMGVSQAFMRQAMQAGQDVFSILSEPVASYGSVRLGALKVNFVGSSRQLSRSGEAYVRVMDELVWDYIENIGASARQRALSEMELVPGGPEAINAFAPGATANGLPARIGSNVDLPASPDFVANVDDPKWYFDGVRNVALAFDVPEADALRTFKLAVTRAAHSSAQLGWELADYDTYISAMETAAQRLTMSQGREFDVQFFRSQIEAELAGIDVGLYRATGQVTPTQMVDDIRFVGPLREGRRLAVSGEDVPPYILFNSENRVSYDNYFIDRLKRTKNILEDSIDLQGGSTGKAIDPELLAQLRIVDTMLAEIDSSQNFLRNSGWRDSRGSDGRIVWERSPETPGVIPEGVEPPPWLIYDMSDYDLFKREVAYVFESQGNPFAHLSPESYLRGLQEGYMRRVFGAKLDPNAFSARVRMRDLALFPSSTNMSGLVARVTERFGDDAGEAVGRYLSGRAENNIIFTEDIFEIISRVTGEPLNVALSNIEIVDAVRRASGNDVGDAVDALFRGQDISRLGYTPEQLQRIIDSTITQQRGANSRWALVNDVIYGEDFDYQFIRDTLKLIESQPRNVPINTVTAGYDPTRTPAAFAARKELSADERAMLLQVKSATGSLAQLSGRGARAMRSQVFLREVYDFLRERGLMYSYDDILNTEVGKRFDYGAFTRGFERAGIPAWGRISDTSGRSFVRIPDEFQFWGPMAGAVVPEDIGRWLMVASQAPDDTMPRIIREGMNLYRRLLLSAYPTVARNAYGQFAVAQMSGIDLVKMVENLPRAMAARREYLDTGSSPTMRGGEKLVSIFEDVGQAAEVRKLNEDIIYSLTRPEVLNEIRGSNPQSVLSTIGRRLAESIDAMAQRGYVTIGEMIQLDSDNPVVAAGARLFNQTYGKERIPTFGALDAFQATEEVTRISIYLTVLDELLDAGVPLEQAVRRAAFQGNTAVNNYANVPLVVSQLRNTGLALFPAFSYFQVSRTLRAMWENPQALSRQQRFIQGTGNVLATGLTDEDRQLLYERMPSHTRGQPGIWVSSRLWGGDGETLWRIPLEKIFPIGFGDFAGLAEQAAGGGIYNNIYQAWAANQLYGRPPSAQKFGTPDVFDIYDTPLEQLISTLLWTVSQYTVNVGPAREFQRGLESIEGQAGPFVDWLTMTAPAFGPEGREIAEYRREMAAESGSYGVRTPAQFLIRQLGFNTYTVDILSEQESVSAISRQRNVKTETQVYMDAAFGKASKLAADWPEGSPQFVIGVQQIEQELMQALARWARANGMSEESVRRELGDEINKLRRQLR